MKGQVLKEVGEGRALVRSQGEYWLMQRARSQPPLWVCVKIDDDTAKRLDESA